jgi:hypothetical protein
VQFVGPFVSEGSSRLLLLWGRKGRLFAPDTSVGGPAACFQLSFLPKQPTSCFSAASESPSSLEVAHPIQQQAAVAMRGRG